MAEFEVVPIAAADDCFHPVSDHPYETETFWASFHVPELAMGGWFYNQVLFNQGVCNGGAWLWDAGPEPALYNVFEHGLPLGDTSQLDLRDVELPNGNHIEMLEPLKRYRVRYSDPGRFEADITLEGLREPHSHPIGVAPFWKGRHMDQAVRATGTICFEGKEIEVDSLSMRDRSWGPRPGPRKGGPSEKSKPKPVSDEPRPARPPHSPFGVGYVFGTASADDMFLAYTLPCLYDGEARDMVTAGYLVRDGIYGRIVSGERRAQFDREHRWMTDIDLEACDEHGRELTATAALISHHGESGHGTGYFHWEWNGASGYGEDQTHASDAVTTALLDAGVWTLR